MPTTSPFLPASVWVMPLFLAPVSPGTQSSKQAARRAPVQALFDFPQFAGGHVENDAAHRDLFGNPGMRPDFLDLLPRILLGVLIGEEAHWRRRRISRRSAQLRVQLVICKCREPAAGVVEKQYLCGSEYTVGNNEFRENIIRNRGAAGPDHVDIGLRQTEDSREV